MSSFQNRLLIIPLLVLSFACSPNEEGDPPPLPTGTSSYPYPVSTSGGSGGTTETDGMSSDVFCAMDQPDGCDASEKCVPVGLPHPLGYSLWTHAACRPIATSPRVVGQTCDILHGMSDGHDDCEAGAMCYSTDVIVKRGLCIELCPDGICSSGVCVVDNGGALPICLPQCNPLQSMCGAGEGCLPSGQPGVFACHALQDSAGTSGFPCTTKNGCGSRDVCVPSELGAQTPGIYGHPDVSGYSCARYCDLNDPEALHCEVLGLGTHACIPAPSFGDPEVGVCQRQDN